MQTCISRTRLPWGFVFPFSFRPTTIVRIHYVANGIGAWNVLAGRAPRRHRRRPSFLFLLSDSDSRFQDKKTEGEDEDKSSMYQIPTSREARKRFRFPLPFSLFKSPSRSSNNTEGACSIFWRVSRHDLSRTRAKRSTARKALLG